MSERVFDPREKDIDYLEAKGPITEEKLCAFTGHRPSKLGIIYESSRECLVLKSALHEAIKSALRRGIFSFVTGMAVGIDTWAAEEVLLLKSIYPQIKLYAAIPHREQYSRLFGWQKERYFRILNACEKVFLISENYTSYCHHKRNSFMIENSQMLISVYDGKKGGTANTVLLAEKKGLDILNLAPTGEISPIHNQIKLFEEE